MMRFFDPDAIRKADKKAMEKIGIPGILLMENAGKNCADILLNSSSSFRSVTVLAGPGNNGGDGFVLARHLVIHGKEVTVITSRAFSAYVGEPAVNLEILQKMGITVYTSGELSDDRIREIAGSADICIDALLGTGSSGKPRGECARMISLLSDHTHVISIDLPSGIDPSDGSVFEPCVKATKTITMLAAKTGLATMPGAMYAGDIEVVDIGIPPEEILQVPERITAIEEDMVSSWIPERNLDIHKGKRGCVAAIGSSPQYRGAIALTALASLRSGSGLVYTLSSHEAQELISHFLPEAITMGCSFRDDSDTTVICKDIDLLDRRTDAFVIGPGLGRSSVSAELLDHLWNNLRDTPAVVDADALFHLSIPGNRYTRRANVVLTPHEGEAARLLDSDIEFVRSHRLECVRKLAQAWGVVILKGARTLVDDGHRTAAILEGSPSLAIPGSGDVLSGIIASFLAAGTDPFHSACAASWIHAKIGHALAVENGVDGILAREIAQMLPSLIQEARSRI